MHSERQRERDTERVEETHTESHDNATVKELSSLFHTHHPLSAYAARFTKYHNGDRGAKYSPREVCGAMVI